MARAPSAIRCFWILPGGARISNSHIALMLGPHYGVAYLAAESGGCRDTAAFWSLPGVAAFNVDTLGTWTIRPAIRSPTATYVWFYHLEDQPEDSATPHAVRVDRRSRMCPSSGIPRRPLTGQIIAFNGTSRTS